MEETKQVVLPSTFLNPLTQQPYQTTLWAYKIDDGTTNFGPLYPAFTIEAQKGSPTTVTYINYLSNSTIPFYRSAVDQTLHWADPQGMFPSFALSYDGPIPAVVHLHGGEVPSAYDGGPDAWFTPEGTTGPGYVTNIFEYPNDQLSATLWYHDHALGVTRLNVYAGMAGFYFLRDEVDTGIPGTGNLPAGNYEIEIAIQDRMFDTNGELFYPVGGMNPTIHPIWQPEFFGDVIVVNGKTWPYLDVEPRRYRFRLLNGSNSRFYEMWLQNQLTGAMGPAFWQIGTDGGLLEIPFKVDPAVGSFLVMGPGERVDLIIDFTGFDGQIFTLRNKARSPYPKGAPADPQTTGQIMQFRVVLPLSGTDDSYNPANGGILRPLTKLVNFPTATPNVAVQQKRLLTLNEVMAGAGPVEALLNNTKWDGRESPNTGMGGMQYGNFFAEMPVEGTTEIWQIVNLTGDAHPIHLHLTQFQLVSRQRFNVNKYNKVYNAAFPAVPNWFDPMTGMIMNYPGGVYVPAYGPPLPYGTVNADGAIGGNPAISPYLQGPVMPANPNERGWKDTFVMYPGEVTTIIVRFSPQSSDLSNNNPYYSFDPSAGPGYVWHCHILKHEDNEMMRPYQVVANLNAPVGRPAPGAGIDYPPPLNHGVMAKKNTILASMAEGTTPNDFTLFQNYPNPFNPTTQISFQLPEASEVKLSIYNTLGQEVRTLVSGNFDRGVHSVSWDATNNFGNKVASGIYLYRIEASNFVQQKKMILMK